MAERVSKAERAYSRKVKEAVQLLFFTHHRLPGVRGWELRQELGTEWLQVIDVLDEQLKTLDLKVTRALEDPDIVKGELVTKGEKVNQGVGLLEAPRGTLFHHYEINGKDQVIMANLIVSTTNNNQPMNEAVNYIAKTYMTGQDEISEPMMNAVEVGIRAYDPCLSCATHAFGQMPLEVSLFNSSDQLIDYKIRS